MNPVGAQRRDQRGIAVEQNNKPVAPISNQRVALVIGNSAYATSPLKNPVNDARGVTKALQGLGFEVIYKENLGQNDMKRAVRAFGEKIRSGGIGLFYYAGHGVQVNGVNYLVPVDAKIESEEEVEYECVDAGFVLAQLDSAKNRLNIVILDACRNNPFARSFRSASRGLAQMDAPSGTLIAYATAPGSVASDGTGENGLYTQELLKSMQTPGVGIEEVFKRVRISVRGLTQGKQTPWESSSLTGDFYFNQARVIADKLNPAAVEIDAWEKINGSTEVADYRGYLEQYPDGMFADIAKSRSEKLSLPSIDELLDKYLNSIGGRDAINQIKTIVSTGSVELVNGQQKSELALEMYVKRPGKYLAVKKIGNVIIKDVYDGDMGWVYSSTNGTKPAAPINIQIQRRGDAWTYLDSKELEQLYSKIIVKGKDNLGERKVIVVEATLVDGKVDTLYFDEQKGYLLRFDTWMGSAVVQGGLAVPVQLYIEDYVEVNGVKIPMTFRQIAGGMTITMKLLQWGVKVNVPLDDSLFAKPTK